MNSASSRSFRPDLHQHDGSPDPGDLPVRASAGEEPGESAGMNARAGKLWREGDKVLYRAAGEAEPAAVRVLWARPLSGRGGPVSLMQSRKKREVAYLPSLDVFDPESRRVAEEELAASLVLPRILRIRRVVARLGNYYFDVETDRGDRKFLLSSPEVNSYRSGRDAIVIKDVSGNAYEIASVSGLERASRRELDRVL